MSMWSETREDIHHENQFHESYWHQDTHQAWLQSLNANKSNFFAENEANKETVRMQRLLIAQLEKELETKKVTIEYLKRNIDWFRETLEQNQNDHIHFDG